MGAGLTALVTSFCPITHLSLSRFLPSVMYFVAENPLSTAACPGEMVQSSFTNNISSLGGSVSWSVSNPKTLTHQWSTLPAKLSYCGRREVRGEVLVIGDLVDDPGPVRSRESLQLAGCCDSYIGAILPEGPDELVVKRRRWYWMYTSWEMTANRSSL